MSSRSHSLLPVAIVLLWHGTAAGQASEDVSVSMLQAPPSPAFVLLGVEPSSVERPGSVSDFSASFLSASGELSVLPESYAVSFAPYWLLGAGEETTFREYRSSVGIAETVARTLSLSAAFSPTPGQPDGSEATSGGFGLRFSLFEGEISDAFNPELVSLIDLLQTSAQNARALVAQALDADAEYQELSRSLREIEAEIAAVVRQGGVATPDQSAILTSRQAAVAARADEITSGPLQALLEPIQEQIGRTRLRRTGFKLDVAAGLVFDFPDRSIRSGDLVRGGAWLTTGYDWGGGVALGVARFMGSQRGIGSDAFDLGGRLDLDRDRFALSMEAVYRWLPQAETIDVIAANQSGDPNAPVMQVAIGDHTWRLSGGIEYSVAKNQTLSFNFGRDFEGRREGNLIAALNFIVGLGTERLGALGGG